MYISRMCYPSIDESSSPVRYSKNKRRQLFEGNVRYVYRGAKRLRGRRVYRDLPRRCALCSIRRRKRSSQLGDGGFFGAAQWPTQRGLSCTLPAIPMRPKNGQLLVALTSCPDSLREKEKERKKDRFTRRYSRRPASSSCLSPLSPGIRVKDIFYR